MKKFSLMASLAALVTVGGVYATWNYAEANAGSANQDFYINLETVETNTKKGTISMTGALPLSVDDGGNYHVKLIKAQAAAQGLTVTFTPNTGASVETIPMQVVVSVNDAKFTLTQGTAETNDDTTDVYMTANTTPLTATEIPGLANVGTSGVLIPIDLIMSKLTLTDVVLDTYQDYQDYNATLNQLKITVTVSEVTA